ncbi:MAG TPA: adenylate/guanylate cyclase domain-containing protein [Xanthobacteraceae bacterium]|nr:adenylate/guanylate cyclase domain-containing protein [Xanthobacteraceae bacterium]
MRCPECEQDNPRSNVYCERCGVRLVAKCSRCGHGNTPTAQFCGACGASLNVKAQSEDEDAQYPIQGERKQATILFADIVGSTQLVAGLDPEEAIARLRPALELMSSAAKKFGSSVVHFLGDGIMAVFGAPQAHERHALLACSAALAMQEAVSRSKDGLSIRIGLHSGIVVAGALEIGSFPEGARGPVVFLARRVQELANPGEICITSDTCRLVRSYCDVYPLGRRTVKGFDDAIEVYRLLGHKRAVTSEQFRNAALTPFRGRDQEFARLQQGLANAADGNGCVIGISAAPGAGKSRICYEFGEWCRSQNVPIIEARALPYSHATPYQPVLELLRSFFQTSDTPAIARVRIARAMLALDPAFEFDLQLVYEFMGVAGPDDRPLMLEPKSRQIRLRNILSRIVRLVGVRTSVVIFEDLHWLDEASSDLVETLVESVKGTHILLVLNYRPSYVAPWMKQPHFTQTPLSDFDSNTALAFVTDLIGSKPELAKICYRIADRSNGNPFFAEELINALEESGELRGSAGNYELAGQGSEEALPATVHAALSARIDRVHAEDKNLLQIAAVVGTEFPAIVVRHMAQCAEKELDQALDRLCDAELIQRHVGAGAGQFMFRHPLIQEVAYETQLKSRRTALHAAAATVLAGFYKDRLDEFAGLLAYHNEAAGRNIEAAKFGAKAARWIGKNDSAQALKTYKKARDLLGREGRSKALDPYRLSTTLQILNFGWRQGMTAEEAKPFAEEAQQLAIELGHKMAHTMSLVVYGRIIAASGAADEYVRLTREALSLVADEKNSGRLATLNASLSQAYFFAGLLKEALDANIHAQQSVGFMDKHDTEMLGFDVEHWITSLRGRILVALGRFAEAEELLTKLVPILAKARNPILQYLPHSSYVEMAWSRGNAPMATEHASRISEIADHSSIPYLQVQALASLGIAQSTAGDNAAAVASFVKAIGSARSTKAGWENEPAVLAHLASTYLSMGEFEEADKVAQEAVELARQRTARLPELHALIVSAGALAGKDKAAGQKFFRLADELLQTTGAKLFDPLLSQVRAGLYPHVISSGGRVA